MALSELALQKLVPKKKRFDKPDGNGLYLRVMPTGIKTWFYRYMLEGKARRMTLGNYPDLGSAEAREMAARARKQVKEVDAVAVRKAAKATRKAAPDVADPITEF